MLRPTAPGGSTPPGVSRSGRRRPRLGLRGRMVIGFAVLAAVITGVFAVVGYARIVDDVVREREEVALGQAYANARIVRARLRASESDPGSVVASLESRRGTPVVRFGGEWFAASVGVGPDDVPDGLLRLVADGTVGHQRVRLGDDVTVVVGVPVVSVGADYYEFVPIGDVESTLSSVRRSLLISALLAGAVGALVGSTITRTVLRPLRRVADAATRVRSGDLDTHVAVTGDRALDPLLVAFNDMVDELRRRVERDARFAGDVTHELRGPLATLSVAVTHAKRHLDEPERLRYALDTLDDTVERFSRLVVDLLEMSRIEAGVAELDIVPVDIHAFADAIIAASRNSELRLQIDPDVPPFVAFDKRRVAQCVTNLLQNAERYGGGATELWVGRSGGNLTIAVDDDGPGVPKHERQTIFERFTRGEAASDVAGGTGLGLFIVAEHMRLHGGGVVVTESRSGGARFALSLPLEPV